MLSTKEMSRAARLEQAAKGREDLGRLTRKLAAHDLDLGEEELDRVLAEDPDGWEAQRVREIAAAVVEENRATARAIVEAEQERSERASEAGSVLGAEAEKLAHSLGHERLTGPLRQALSQVAPSVIASEVASGDPLRGAARVTLYKTLAAQDPEAYRTAIEDGVVLPGDEQAVLASAGEALRRRIEPTPGRARAMPTTKEGADALLRSTNWRMERGELVGDTDAPLPEEVGELPLSQAEMNRMSPAQLSAAMDRQSRGEPVRLQGGADAAQGE